MAIFLNVFLFLVSYAAASSDNCSDGQEVATYWRGSTREFGEFQRMDPQLKAVLKNFELVDVENLEISILLASLAPCLALESLYLYNVELLGEFPAQAADKVHLPNLINYHLELSSLNYPPDPYYFVLKDSDAAYANINNFVKLGGVVVSVSDVDYYTFLIGYNNSEFVAHLLSNIEFKIDHATYQVILGHTDLTNASLVPNDLTWLELMECRVVDAVTGDFLYNKIVAKNSRLRELHLKSLPEDDRPLLNLADFPSTITSLSLANFRLNVTGLQGAKFNDLESLYMENCKLEGPLAILGSIDSVVPHPKRFGFVFPEDGRNCLPFLDKVINSPLYQEYENLELIFIVNCQWANDFEIELPIVQWLLSVGLKIGAKDFVLEYHDGDWAGRIVGGLEKKRLEFQFQRWDKLEDFEVYRNR